MEFDADNEAVNIIEEVLESFMYDVPKENRNELGNKFSTFIAQLRKSSVIVPKDIDTDTEHEEVDAYNDIIVFAIGSLMKLGYDPRATLEETIKEVLSRDGEIINGKFVKHTDEESKSKWYKSSFEHCKLAEEQCHDC